MYILITIALSIALGIALLKLRSHRVTVTALEQAIQSKQPLLSEDFPGAAGSAWERLRLSCNAMITELDQLNQQRTGQLAQLEATLGSLQEAVLIVDSNNYILLANKALQAISPRPADQIIGHRLELALHSAEFLTYVEAVRRGKALPQQEVEFIEGGRTTWLEVTGTVIQNNSGAPWTIFVLHNITKQKNLESVRKEFVANVSHELRTPLSVIKGYIETLVDAGDAIPASDRDQFLKTIQRHADRLDTLLEDLLALSRLESSSPGLTREPTHFPALLDDIIHDYRGRPAAANHQLSYSIHPSIQTLSTDPLKISQAIENLLDNALKYTPAGSTIALHAHPNDTDEVIVSVRDNGPGIPPEDQPHIFERFYRVDKGRSREKGGTGLGLSIVKQIVQLHGGRVWLESKLGEGTTFFFSLPHR